MSNTWGSYRHITSFAKGETVHARYLVKETNGKIPTTEVGMSFFLTVADAEGTKVIEHTFASDEIDAGMVMNEALGREVLELHCKFDSNLLAAETEYFVDVWLTDPDTGRDQVDYYTITLRKPQTIFQN